MSETSRQLTILDVGHGNSAVLKGETSTVIIDTAKGSSLLEFLREQQIHRLDTIFLSHADHDHIGGLTNLLASKEISIGEIRLNSDSLKNSEIWDDLLESLDARALAGEIDFQPSLTRNTCGLWDRPDLQIEILGPSPYLASKGPGSRDKQGRKISSNSISAVIRVLRDGNPIALFPGDLDEVGLDSLVDDQMDAQAPVLVFPHHGGRPKNDPVAFAKRLCQIVQPDVVIFSMSRGGKGMNPLPEVVEAIGETFPSARIACTQLSRHCATELPSQPGQHLAEHFASGRKKKCCCAGSIALDLEDRMQLAPKLSEHLLFIERFAPDALCRRTYGQRQ